MQPQPRHNLSRLYRSFMDDVSQVRPKCLQVVDKAIEKSELRNRDVHRIESLNWHGRNFICEVQAGNSGSYYTLYKILPHNKSFFCIAFNEKDKVLYHFTPHFFERYHERLELSYEEADRLMSHYLHQNSIFRAIHSKRKGRRFASCRAVFKNGAGYGLFDQEQRIYYFRTFISFDKMNFNKKVENNVALSQKEIIDMLSKKFNVAGNA